MAIVAVMPSISQANISSLLSIALVGSGFDLVRFHGIACCYRHHGYRHGLRTGEVCTLRWDQFDMKQGMVHVNRLKNGIESVQPTTRIDGVTISDTGF